MEGTGKRCPSGQASWMCVPLEESCVEENSEPRTCNSILKSVLKEVMALPFLPPDLIIPVFSELRQRDGTDRLYEVFRYINDAWIRCMDALSRSHIPTPGPVRRVENSRFDHFRTVRFVRKWSKRLFEAINETDSTKHIRIKRKMKPSWRYQHRKGT